MVLPRFPGLEFHPVINVPALTRRSRILGLCACLVFALAACTAPGIMVGAGATGAVAASEERGLEAAINDSRISTEINYYWLEHDRELLVNLSTAVYEGRVMLTGVTISEAKRDDAVRLAWKPDGVTEVINEIIVDAKGASSTFARDAWISAKLRSRILFDGEIQGINYSIETVRGTVFLLGVAQNREEMQRVLNHARNLSYVLRVINHVILETDPRRPKKKPESGKKPEG